MPAAKRHYEAGSARRLAGLMATLVLLAICAASCQKSYRRDDPSPHNDGGQPDSRVEPASDPRFPRSREQTDRTGLWVEQPVETGSFSATTLANTVADELPDVDKHCCAGGSEQCGGMSGRLLLDLKIAADGQVLDVAVAETTLDRRDFQMCLLERASRWRLSRPRGRAPMEVVVPVGARYERSDEQ